MAHKKVKVPIIAITPEAEEDDDHNYTTLADALTDVETLEFDNDAKSVDKPRHKLKIKLATDEDGAITDTEDVEASGDELLTRIVAHDKPISIDDLDLDPGVCRETHKIRSRNSKGKKKLHTQSSTITEPNAHLNLDGFRVNDGTTDVEYCSASEDDVNAVIESTMPDQLLDVSINTQISEVLRKESLLDEAKPKRLTDVENLDSDSNTENAQKVLNKRKVKRRRPKHASSEMREWAERRFDCNERRSAQKPAQQRQNSEDSDVSDANNSCYIKFGNEVLSTARSYAEGHTDVEALDSSNDEGNDALAIPVAIVKKCKKGNGTDEEVLSDADLSYQIEPFHEAPLPKPFRKMITLRETRSDRPIVTITPIDDDYKTELRFDHSLELTDEEFFSDTDALLFAEALSRGPTPEFSIFDGGFDDVTESIRLRRRSLRPLSPSIIEVLTDTEDIFVSSGRNKRAPSKYLASLTVGRPAENQLTDTEDLVLSDHGHDRRNSDCGTDYESVLMSDDEYLSEKVDLLRALSTTPICMREMGGDTVLSMEGSGPFTDNSRLSINRRVPLMRNAPASPMVTDTEDFSVSDEDEDFTMYLRRGSTASVGLRKESVHAQNSPQDVMYLKGGSYREVCTDTEYANASDGDYHACASRKKFSVDILSDNNVLVSMKKTCANFKDCPVGPFRFKNEWDATGKSSVGGPVFPKGKPAVDAAEKQDASFGLTQTSAELIPSETHLTTEMPKPKPRAMKPTDLEQPRESQKSPVRDDILDTDLVPTDVSTLEEETPTYEDKKKFWETIATDSIPESSSKTTKRMSLHDELLVREKPALTKRISLHEEQQIRPVPKPRSLTQTSDSFDETPKPISFDSSTSETTETTNISGSDVICKDSSLKIMSEYQSQFQSPCDRKTALKQSNARVEFRSQDSFESDKPLASQEQGYISDSEDVEHYISDSEIEDRVPQIRTRQMSMYQPAIPMRKSIYERSMSLPTEDLYDISAAMLLRKQHFEEQLRKDMVEEQLATDEDGASPEHKALCSLQRLDDEPSGTRSVPESTNAFQPSVKDLAKAFETADKTLEATSPASTKSDKDDKQKLADYAELFMSEQRMFEREATPSKDHKTVQRSSTESEKSLSDHSMESSDGILLQSNDAPLTKDDSISRPGDSMEVHVDKSEVEDSEKITDNEQDATDIETKSLDSLNAAEVTPKPLVADEVIPEITVTLSGKQRRISEDSDGSFEGVQQEIPPITPIAEKSETSSPVHHPEQCIDSTIWESSVQSEPSFEKVVEFPPFEMKIDEDELRRERSESFTSDRLRSESHSEIEQIILESLHNQNILPDEARRIAAELLEDIENEIQKRHHAGATHDEASTTESARSQVSDYVRQLAETKGLDSREIQLVESVLARKQRQFSSLKRDDTQASSMEITDEDLKFSGTDIDYSPALILEQLEAEQASTDVTGMFSLMKKEFEDRTSDKVDEQSTDESFISKSSSSLEDGRQSILNTEIHTKTTDRVKSEQSAQEAQEGDAFSVTTVAKEHASTDSTQAIAVDQIRAEIGKDAFTLQSSKARTDERSFHADDTLIETKAVTTDTMKTEKATTETKNEDIVEITGKYDAETKTQALIDHKIVDTREKNKLLTEGFIQREIQSTIDDSKQTVFGKDGAKYEIEEVTQTTRVKLSSTSKLEDETHKEVKTTTTDVTEVLAPQEIEALLKSKEITIVTHEEVERTLSDESKSSQDESMKSPEDVFSTCSSGRKGDSDTASKTAEKQHVLLRKTKGHKDADTSSSSGNLKPERKSGIDFETYSSSGESHYHSFDLDSGKSRPCSSDVEGLLAAGSSEYESALTSQEMSGRSHGLSEYHTAASSLSSKESMKSLDSESSGNLASVEVSEISETLIASELEYQGDEDYLRKDRPTRQGTQFSDSDLLSFPDVEGSMDVSEDEFSNEPKLIEDAPSRMKRSQEMTFQPEPKVFLGESPQSETYQEGEEKFGCSVDEGSVLSMSLSSTSSVAALRTVIELSRADSERLEGSMNISATSEQLSLEDMDNLPRGSRESLVNVHLPQQETPTTADSFTSTHPQFLDLTGGSVTITSSVIAENGIQSVSTQVTSRSHTPTPQDELDILHQISSAPECDEVPVPKKKGHRRHESTSAFTPIPPSVAQSNRELFSELTESDKYTTELSVKEVTSDEKKDIDETEREESYETEADQGFHRDQRESQLQNEIERDNNEKTTQPDPKPIALPKSEPSDLCDECEIKDDTPEFSSETQASVGELEQEYSSAVARTSESHVTEIRRTSSKEDKISSHKDILDKRDSHVKTSASSSEKSSFEEAEAEAAFSMVAHISPAHKVKQICPILEDEDAEKHELETRERAQKELEERRAQIRDHSPGAIPDIKVTQHMTPLIDRDFHYPDLELEEQAAETQESTPETPASNSSKTSEETDQGKEYVLDDGGVIIPDDVDAGVLDEKSEKGMTESKSEVGTVIEKTIQESDKGMESQTESPNSDSFEMLEKPDLMDDFVIIEEVGKEAFEQDTEGKSVRIAGSGKKSGGKKHDEEVENFLIKSSPATKTTDVKYYPEGAGAEDLGFEFEDSPPQLKQKDAGVTAKDASGSTSRDYVYEYDRELEANKKWIEQQFQGDQAVMMAVGYGYEMDFERAPLEDIKEEEVTDFDPSSSRIGSVGSQKESGGSLGSVKDSFSSTPDYDVLAGRKYFTRSGENDDVSMSSLQEFENLERAMSLENRRYHQGSQDSSSNGSFGKRVYASRNAQGDEVSASSLKEFEGLEKACIAVTKIEQKVKEEEAMLTQIEEGQESIASESGSCETMSGTDKKLIPDSDEEDYEKRMFEIDEIIRQAQSNVEKFIDMKDDEKPESIGRGDSLEEVSKVPDLDLDMPLSKESSKLQWAQTDDLMATSTDSLDIKLDKPSRNDSTDSLDQKTAADIMTTSTDSIEFQTQQKSGRDIITSDSIEFKEIPDYSFMMTSSDSLELETGTGGQIAALLSDSIDEDGSRICVYDQSSSSTGKDFSSSVREDPLEQFDMREQLGFEPRDPLDISSSTATHATCHYETDSVFSGSFTSGGSNTMVSSTDTIDPSGPHVVDLAAAVRKVWFDDDSDAAGKRFTTEYMDDASKPYVTEVIEPCEDDDYYSHTIHRRMELPPEVRKVTFKGPDADEQMRAYMRNFDEGEDEEQFEEVDADGNVHVKRVVQKRYVVKSDEKLEEKDKKPIDWNGQGVIKRTFTDGQGTKTIYTQKFGLKHMEGLESTSAGHSLLSSIASDAPTGEIASGLSPTEPTLPRQPVPFKDAGEEAGAEVPSQGASSHSSQRYVSDQQQLSEEMRQLLRDMEEETKK